ALQPPIGDVCGYPSPLSVRVPGVDGHPTLVVTERDVQTPHHIPIDSIVDTLHGKLDTLQGVLDRSNPTGELLILRRLSCLDPLSRLLHQPGLKPGKLRLSLDEHPLEFAAL